MGTSDFAVPTLEKLIDQKEWEIITVVTQPDRPSGRGRKLAPSPVKIAAEKHRLPTLQPEKVREKTVIQHLKDLAPDVIVVVAYGQILTKNILELPPSGCLNIHPSLLPKYRGAAPIQWALINGEKETGVTIMLLDEGEDTGDIISQKAVEILADETSIDLHDRLANLAPSLLIKAIEQCKAEGGKPFHYPQDNRKSSQAPKLTKSTGIINWNDNAEQIYNLVRGTFGWPGAKTQLAGVQVKIINCTVLGLQLISGQIKVIRDPNEGLSLVVGTSLGSLKLNTIQPATKGPMSAVDFINGYGIKSGDYAHIND